jgi:proteasome assembly chaperone (PAC2) family protein
MPKVQLRDPWLVACWPGMGSVALLAGLHLARTLPAERIEELPTDGFFDVGEIGIRRGVLQPVARPHLVLHAYRDPGPAGRDLLLFLADAQPSARGWELCEALLERVAEHGVKRVVTFASLATPMVPGSPVKVHAVASSPALLSTALVPGVSALEEGSIGGLNGVLVAVAAARGLEGLCLLGTFPFVAPGVPNPSAAAAVLRAFARLSALPIDVTELEVEGKGVDRQLAQALATLQERAAAEDPGPEEPEGKEEEQEEEGATEALEGEAPIPDDEAHRTGLTPEDRERLERMFRGARRSREKAVALKAELDRLGVFAEYEDRFLDLFRRGE